MGKPGVGLALSGGAARGIAHAGVLEVLVDAGIVVRALAGTSAGAVVGALFAAGMSPVEIGRMALETRWSDLLRVRVPHAGMISGDGLERFFERVIPAQTFAELRLPFAAVATDLATGKRVDCTSGPLARAVLASCSLPVLLEPVEQRGRLLVDGGVSSQLPVRAVRDTLGVPRSSPWTSMSAAWNGRTSNRSSTWRSTSRCSGPPARRERRKMRRTW